MDESDNSQSQGQPSTEPQATEGVSQAEGEAVESKNVDDGNSESPPTVAMSHNEDVNALKDKFEKASTALESMEKDRAALEKDKMHLEKELKKANDLLAKTKERAAIQQYMDENSRLKLEVEVLQDQKAQNAALKENMHHMAQQFDQQRIQLARLTKQVSEGSSQPTESGDVPKLTMELIDSFEKTIKELRDENLNLISSLKNMEGEVSSLKEKKALEQATSYTATTQAKGWWTKSSTVAVANSPPAKPAEEKTLKPDTIPTSTAKAGAPGGGWQWWNKSGSNSQNIISDASKQDPTKSLRTSTAALGEGHLSDSSSSPHLPESEASPHQNSESQVVAPTGEMEKIKDELRRLEEKHALFFKKIEDSLKDVHDSSLKSLIQDILSCSESSGVSTMLKDEPIKNLTAQAPELSDTKKHEEELAAIKAELSSLREKLSQNLTEIENGQTEMEKLKEKLTETTTNLTKKNEEYESITKTLHETKNENDELKVKAMSIEIQQRLENNGAADKIQGEIEERINAQKSAFEERLQKEKKINAELLEKEKRGFELKLKEEKERHESILQREVSGREDRLNKEIEAYESLRNEKISLEKSKQELEEALKKQKQNLEERIKKEKTEMEQYAQKERADVEEKHKKEKAELEERIKKEKTEAEQAFMKEKADFEEKLKKEKSEVEERAKKEKAESDEKLKKEKAALEEKAKKEKIEVEEKAKKERLELEEKWKKERHEADERVKREKNDAEEKSRKEKTKLQQDYDKIKAEFEKAKKDQTTLESTKGDQLKKLEKDLASKTEELAKASQRAKTLEIDLSTSKSDLAKSSAALKDATDEKQTVVKELEALKNNHLKYEEEIKSLNEKLANHQSKYDILTAENEVQQSSYERLSKASAEKDDQLKKLKAKVEELTHTEQVLRRQTQKLEKEKEDLETKYRKSAVEAESARTAAAEARAEKDAFQTEIQKVKEGEVTLREELENAQRKVADTEHELKIVERRSAQLVKDLQKQLMKERKNKEIPEEVREHETLQEDKQMGRTSFEAKARARGSILMTDGGSLFPGDKTKVDMITGDLLKLAQENEQLNKRARNAEEELKGLHDRVNRLSEEMEGKSKVLQQYVLREYSSQLQPDERPKTTFNVSILSNSNAMHKMDPSILSQVNMKMQKLLEELASKVMTLEEENKSLRIQVL
ncbi:hypothetical protein HDU67_002834 [Dinochytrium kinnereticum]|nr:hypothetical protein HDU67_002834 [Dinochytrium kinnereticum]